MSTKIFTRPYASPSILFYFQGSGMMLVYRSSNYLHTLYFFCSLSPQQLLQSLLKLFRVTCVIFGDDSAQLDKDESQLNTVYITNKLVVKWVWATMLTLSAPEVFSFFRSLHRSLFKNVKRPTVMQFFIVWLVETLQAVGVGILVFRIIPDLDAVTATQLTNALCIIPALLLMLSRRPNRVSFLLIIIDIAAISAQSFGFLLLPALLPILQKHSISITICLILISSAWWQNFVHIDSIFPFIRNMAKAVDCRMRLDELLQRDPFGEKLITITGHHLNQTQIDKFLVRMSQFDGVDYDEITKRALITRSEVMKEVYESHVELNQFTLPYDALWIVVVQVTASFICYESSIFACKVGRVMMQRFGFALPMALATPTTVFLLSTTCMLRSIDSCHLTNTLSKVLAVCAFSIPVYLRLFILPCFVAAFIDQSLAFNRRRDDKTKIRPEVSHIGRVLPSRANCLPFFRDSACNTDSITKIYACATMWHETTHEMTCMLKSIFRMDEDQCARRNAQKYLKVIDPDYYEFEAHIFLDDAFNTDEYGNETINKFARQIISVVDEAASAVHQTQMRLKPPKKLNTPYGGRLEYILPGKNKLTVHLKDKNRIRHRKRWSQEVISENTFILTLDGDVDFTPHCVHLLVDLMKKNRRLGAACGRIHPRGSGLMIWYQKFEYAIGHWLQKATEHMIGCVMCSPGCFSLFRSYALMDDNVTRKYASKSEEPIDYIQYDQGEDRWLCTLLLQRGYRVEYCAASDALTFAPEGFNEFFNQRRRWIPSTIANVIDLLKDYKNVVSVNESISIWYILYQMVMLVSSILGPGTIFLMVVGAISISFNLDTIWSLLIVTLPVATFCIVCLTAKPEKQLLMAQIVGALFAMLMTAVCVGTSLQIQKDGIFSPHSIFLFSVIGSFLTAAILHPLEFTCIIPGILYFLGIPCMYMLLPIYSICNLNTVSWGTREDPRPHEKNDLARIRRGQHLDLIDSHDTEVFCVYLRNLHFG
ncbi:Chitin synthase [Dictyocaulus viviparus]|uniref:chitin synthase n=1 Tax=Dictyocaulus viviparus TaxID=29172 RepID=A0A0D8Y0T9_DICVI|nr:Chitin synthase [Dictyocaulus viviparus]